MKRAYRALAWLLLLAFLLLALVACLKSAPATIPTLLPTVGPKATAFPTRTFTRTPSPTPTLTPTPTPTSTPSLSALARHMLELVNRDRQAAGLNPLEWDETAAQVGQAHAEEMVTHGYLSHWNFLGYGPEHRYFFAGGRDVVRENVYSFYQRYNTGEGVPIEDWEGTIASAQQKLMESPGHRENILQPSHTHVGIGIAYDPKRGELRIAQEFVDRYVAVEPVPGQVSLGGSLEVAGRVLPGASSPLLNLAYEPFPQPMTMEALNTTSTYQSAAETYQAVAPNLQGDRFAATIRFNATDKPGLYHLRIWVAQSGEQIVASDLIVAVQ